MGPLVCQVLQALDSLYHKGAGKIAAVILPINLASSLTDTDPFSLAVWKAVVIGNLVITTAFQTAKEKGSLV